MSADVENSVVLACFTVAAVAFGIVAIALLGHIGMRLKNRFIGETFKPGKDVAVIACGSCDVVAIAFNPASIPYARQHMAQHYREHPEHGYSIETIPAGWDR